MSNNPIETLLIQKSIILPNQTNKFTPKIIAETKIAASKKSQLTVEVLMTFLPICEQHRGLKEVNCSLDLDYNYAL